MQDLSHYFRKQCEPLVGTSREMKGVSAVKQQSERKKTFWSHTVSAQYDKGLSLLSCCWWSGGSETSVWPEITMNKVWPCMTDTVCVTSYENTIKITSFEHQARHHGTVFLRERKKCQNTFFMLAMSTN